MQEVVASFTTVMTWIVMGLASVAVGLLIVSVLQLPSHQGRALLGVGGMVLVLVATVASLPLLAGRAPHSGASLQLVLPLLAVLLIACLYALTFPPLVPSRPGLSQRRRLWLLLLTGLAGVCTVSLVLLELLAPYSSGSWVWLILWLGEGKRFLLRFGLLHRHRDATRSACSCPQHP
jgi:hypothetical protein